MAEIERGHDDAIVPIRHPEGELAAVAEVGLDADDTLARIRNMGTAERALNGSEPRAARSRCADRKRRR
jgi:hypothetical protein